MISPKSFFNFLIKSDIQFFTGVPDSLLKEFCLYVENNVDSSNHIISTCEGSAISIATGYHLATNKLPLVYLQNSGIGNTINPLLSLADKDVYSIPMVLLIGWRGNPNNKDFKDEPQHIKQGRVTTAMFDAMKIPYQVLSKENNEYKKNISWAINEAKHNMCPVVILVEKDTFDKSGYLTNKTAKEKIVLTREDTIHYLSSNISSNSHIVSSTGMISRELYESRVKNGQNHSSDFLTVGSMGFASQIAFGISNAKPEKKIFCFDGDGAALMHMGGFATIGSSILENLNHILLNNGVHDSVGGQPTLGFNISFTKIAQACNYKNIIGPIYNFNDLQNGLKEMIESKGPSFMEIRVLPGSRKNLGRPIESPKENKLLFECLLRK